MLIRVSSPQHKRQVFLDRDWQSSTWVVTDLKSKLSLQEILLKDNAVVPGKSLLRASELWADLLSTQHPHWRVIGQQFALLIIKEFFKENDFGKWTRTPGAARRAYEYMGQLLTFLVHPEGLTVINEWFSNNPARAARWQHWAKACWLLWHHFCEQKLTVSAWIPGVLVQQGLKRPYERSLVFDLGPDLRAIEAELIRNLAAQSDVRVLQPQPLWIDELKRTLNPYEGFEFGSQDPEEQGEAQSSSRPITKKFTTMLAEVKEATSTVRGWLDSGVEAQKITIVAPDIGLYWPVLSEYLEVEGTPAQRDKAVSLQTLPDIAKWISLVRIQAGQISSGDIELSVYGQDSSTEMSFDRFKRLFSNVYSLQDISREQSIKNYFEQSKLKTKGPISSEEFFSWILKLWRQPELPASLTQFLQKFLRDCPDNIRFQLADWSELFQSLLAVEECTVHHGTNNGIQILDLTSAEEVDATHLVFLGATESALRSQRNTSITLSDVLSLHAQTGFEIPFPDMAELEFWGRWLLEKSWQEVVLTSPMTNFDGASEAPALFWMQHRQKAEDDPTKIDLPRRTRWDELQQADDKVLATERGFGEDLWQDQIDRVNRDLGLTEAKSFEKTQVKRFSASAIEDYLKCPFVFAAKRVFRLSDLPDLDLDIDFLTRGRLLHAVFERLLADDKNLSFSQEDLAHVVERSKEDIKLELADQRLWPVLRNRMIELAHRFLQFEKDWRKDYPATQTVGRETEIKGYIQKDTGELINSEQEGAVAFVGKIDRVDRGADGQYAVVDYKSSIGEHSQYPGAVDKNQLQLALYSMAIESHLTDLPPDEVVGAFYFVAKTMSRDVGYRISDSMTDLFGFEDRRRNKLTRNEKSELWGKVRGILTEVLQQVSKGEFAPEPEDQKNCAKCEWSGLCRAPHLN
jgi:ATP-dependent helicase/nuclease subunit B